MYSVSRSKGNKIIALILVVLLLSACTAQQADNSERSISNSSQPNLESVESESLANLPSSSEIAPTKSYIPESAIELAFVEPSLAQINLKSAPKLKKIQEFNGENYSKVENTWWSSVASAIYSQDDLFFVINKTLYYCDRDGIYSMLDNVRSIAGADANGMYLIVNDDRATKINGVYDNYLLQSSLVCYHPADGTTATIVSSAIAAIVDNEQGMIYYAEPQLEDNKFGYRLAIKRRSISTGGESTLFIDEYVESEGYPRDEEPSDEYKNAAWGVEFYLHNSIVGAVLQYPFPSEMPYARHIWFDAAGVIVADSEKEEILIEKELYTWGFYQHMSNYYFSEGTTYLGPYQVRTIPGEGMAYDFLIMHEGKELYWERQYYGEIIEANELLYSSSHVYNGEYSFALPFGWGDMFIANNQVYYCTSGWDDEYNSISFYKANGTQDNPSSVQLVGRFQAARADDIVLGAVYGSSVAICENYAIVVGDWDNFMVIDLRDDSILAVGIEPVTCLVEI